MDLFAALSPEQKREFDQAYLAHLRRHDGVPDGQGRTFDVREKLFRELTKNPVRRTGAPAIDAAVFARNQVAKVLDPGLDARTLWAVSAAKANRGESYGVNYGFDKGYFDGAGKDDPSLYIAIEETYHTRILKDALDILGLEMEVIEPAPFFQLLIKSMVRLPKALSDVLVFCAEIIGVAAFRLLLEKAREIFSDHPASLAQLERLLAQILIDEVGHVYFLRSRLGPARLKLAKGLLPVMTEKIFDAFPEVPLLHGREKLISRVLAADILGAVADIPGHFVPPEEQPAVAKAA